jgi:sortase A
MDMPANKIIRWIESLLWLVAAATLGVCLLVLADAKLYQFNVEREFERARREQAPSTAIVPAAETENQQPSGPQPPAETPSLPPAQPPAEPPADALYLGRLRIPRLGISTMILDGVDNRTLRLGIGHIPGTALPGDAGNIGIAGHRDTFFRPLGGIHNGDQITVETLGGEYQYTVYSVIVVDPNNLKVLDDIGQPALTLVTCYPFNLIGPASRRLIVRASMVP